MRRMLAHWLISRSIDADREVPAWLRGWLIDEDAARFEASARDLAAALRRDAPAWRTLSPAVASSAAGRNREHHRAWGSATFRWGAVASIAVALAAVGLIWSTNHNSSPNQPQVVAGGGPSSASMPMSPGDVELLMALMGESQTAWGEVVSVLAAPAPRPLPQPRRQSLDAQVEAAFTFFAYRLPASTAKVAGLDRASAMIKSPSSLLRFWASDRGA